MNFPLRSTASVMSLMSVLLLQTVHAEDDWRKASEKAMTWSDPDLVGTSSIAARAAAAAAAKQDSDPDLNGYIADFQQINGGTSVQHPPSPQVFSASTAATLRKSGLRRR